MCSRSSSPLIFDCSFLFVLNCSQEFVNTWSIEGYVEEGKQPAELGWGTHEKHWPHDGKKHDNGWSVFAPNARKHTLSLFLLSLLLMNKHS